MKTILTIGGISFLLLLPAFLLAKEEVAYTPLSVTLIDSLRKIEELQYGPEPPRDAGKLPQQEPSFFSPQALRWIIYGSLTIVLLGVALALIRRFFDADGQAITQANAVTPGSVEELTSTNYLQRMNQAAQTQSWAEALRYSHLWVLQQLQQRGHIRWEPHKTDTDYRLELKDPVLRKAFASSANTFARAWYAEYPVSETDFLALEEIRAVFSGKKGTINTPQAAQP